MMKETENSYKIALGENIRKIRKRQKLTQDVFSEIIGIEPSSLSNIENGKSFPSALTIIQIQEKFNIRVEEIFEVNFPMASPTLDEDIKNKIEKMDDKTKRIVWKIVNAL